MVGRRNVVYDSDEIIVLFDHYIWVFYQLTSFGMYCLN